MSRIFWTCTFLAAALLTPTRAWEASVSQNLSVAIVKETIGLSPTSLTFSPEPPGVPSAAQTVTVSNTGAMAFPLSGVGLAGTNAADFAETNNCPSSVAVGASCLVSVTFAPATVGAMTASVVVSGPGGATYTVALSGTAVSLSGTTIPSAAALGDTSGNVWTVSAGQIYRNGVVDPVTAQVTLLLYYNGTIYQQAHGQWYQLTSTSWSAGANGWTYLASGDPRTASATGTTIPSATAITDASHNVYTVAGGQIYQNGGVDPVTAQVTLLLYYNGNIYQQAHSDWYELTSTSWPAGANGWTYLASGDPRTNSADPSCTGVSVTPASGIQNAVKANPAGTTFCLAAGTYHEQVIPNDNDTFIGAGIGQTIIDGQSNLSEAFGQTGGGDPHVNVTISYMTMKNQTESAVRFGCISPAWTITNSEIAFISSGVGAIATCGNGGLIQNNLIHDASVIALNCVNHTNLVVNNNDFYNNNSSQTSPNSVTGYASNIRCITGGGYQFTNNRMHDSWGNALWFDARSTGGIISGNEAYNIHQACVGGNGCGGGSAFAFEVVLPGTSTTPNWHVHDNYIHDNAAGGVQDFNSGNVEVYNNAFVNSASQTAAAYQFFDEGYRSDQNELGACTTGPNGCIPINNSFHNNYIAVPSGQFAFSGFDGGTTTANGAPANANWAQDNNTWTSNTYYLSSSGAAAFNCATSNSWACSGNYTFAQWQALGFHPDSGSTLNTTTGGTLPNGVGPRGGFVCPAGMTCP
jgi:hypothetical protein